MAVGPPHDPHSLPEMTCVVERAAGPPPAATKQRRRRSGGIKKLASAISFGGLRILFFTSNLRRFNSTIWRALLAQAVEAEVGALLSVHADKLTNDGHRRLVRH